jgi:predicted ATPase/DNA-binding CsgD family transcriptional regulator
MTFVVGDDGLIGAFESAAAAAAAATSAPPGNRLALHTGEARLHDDGRYTGAALHRCERLRDIASGGQTLLTSVTASLVAQALPAGSSLRDLGVHRLRDLSHPDRVFELRSDAAGGESPPLRSLDAYPNNLPIQPTSFVGRQAELAAVDELLPIRRLVTIAGAGGSGKTRLAARAAAEQAHRWRDGVWWVELGAVGDPAVVSDLVASAANVPVEPAVGPLRSLTLQLADRRALVCLDNCEHVLDAAAEVADELLRTCPEVSVIATSREPLDVAGEAVWRVPTLTGDEALSLFVERAAQVRPWFTLDPSNQAAIRRMCARLDGIPLALELAAAWLGTLTPQQIESGLDDRFALLVRGRRGVPARQQTLAASMAWSHDLLEQPDRVVFRRLGVFAGDFDLAAARSVCAHDEVLVSLGRLVDKSLVVAEERDGHARYRLLETIRQYAEDRLRDAGEADDARDRHLDHYLAVVDRSQGELDRDKDAWLGCVEAQYDNLRAALEWGLSAGDPERGRRLAAALAWLWHMTGHGQEGMAFLGRALRRADDARSPLQARLLTAVALVADTAAPLELEYDAAQRALELAGEQGGERLRCLPLALSAVGQFYTDFDAAWELAVEAQRSGEVAGDPFVVDGSRGLRGIILHLRDRHDDARPLLQAAVDGLLGRRDRSVSATLVGFQARAASYTGDSERARRLAERAVDIAAPLGDYHRVGTARSVLALVRGLAGDVDGGLRLTEPFLRLVEGEVFVPEMARALGTLQLWRGELVDAVRWLEPESRSTDRGAETYLAAQALPPLGAALRRLGRDEEASEVLERGVRIARALGMPRILADALEQQAELAAPDDRGRAIELHHQALTLRVEHGLRTFYADSLDALAAASDSPEYAARVLGAADRARDTMGYPRRPVDRGAHEALVAELRSTLDAGAFTEAAAAGARATLDEAVAYVRRTRGTRRRPAGGWASLTPTERDVVRLAAEGHSNPEIGRRLFMSRSTVKTHLSHVYAKLGVANRTELAALAAAHLAARPP